MVAGAEAAGATGAAAPAAGPAAGAPGSPAPGQAVPEPAQDHLSGGPAGGARDGAGPGDVGAGKQVVQSDPLTLVTFIAHIASRLPNKRSLLYRICTLSPPHAHTCILLLRASWWC